MKNKGALRQGRKFLREKGSASLLVFAIIAILYTNLHIYLGVKHTENSTRIIIDSHRMLNLTDQLLSLIQNAHTGQQGYLLTNEATFLETFKQALYQKNQSLQNYAFYLAIMLILRSCKMRYPAI